MIVLVGQIASASEFVPTQAALGSTNDELKVPLALATQPSAKALRDAIVSLSPTQQRFAAAFRSMQLASTLFGVLVLQVKPQLERCLNLPDDTLTKHIQLTQQLTELFTKCVSCVVVSHARCVRRIAAQERLAPTRRAVRRGRRCADVRRARDWFNSRSQVSDPGRSSLVRRRRCGRRARPRRRRRGTRRVGSVDDRRGKEGRDRRARRRGALPPIATLGRPRPRRRGRRAWA